MADKVTASGAGAEDRGHGSQRGTQEAIGDAANPNRAPTDGSLDEGDADKSPVGETNDAAARQAQTSGEDHDRDEMEKGRDKRFLTLANVAEIAFEAVGALRGAGGEPYQAGTFARLSAPEKAQFVGVVDGSADAPEVGESSMEKAKDALHKAALKALKPFTLKDDDDSDK